MKNQEIKKLSKDELMKNIDKLKKDLFNFRFQNNYRYGWKKILSPNFKKSD